MKTLINKNKIRLAGGLMVLLMTAIMAIATAKSYAWEYYSGECWHVSYAPAGSNCGGVPITCGNCCWGVYYWCCGLDDVDVLGDSNCVRGPDSSSGYGFAYCQSGMTNLTIQCGCTITVGRCRDGGCVNLVSHQSTWAETIGNGGAFLYGGLTCYPEN